MLRQASVLEITNGTLTKKDGFLVLVTRYYPRFLKRDAIDDYAINLAPVKDLLTDFKNNEKKLHDHNLAFEKVTYEERFDISDEGRDQLKNLSELSKAQDVYLICYCKQGDCCHRELILLLAESCYGAKIQKVSHPYSVFRQRLRAKEVEC